MGRRKDEHTQQLEIVKRFPSVIHAFLEIPLKSSPVQQTQSISNSREQCFGRVGTQAVWEGEGVSVTPLGQLSLHSGDQGLCPAPHWFNPDSAKGPGTASPVHRGLD